MSESVQAIPPFLDAPAPPASTGRRRAARPTAREWRRHAALLFLTILSTTLAGIMLAIPEFPEPNVPEPTGFFQYLVYIPAYYLLATAQLIIQGVTHADLLMKGLAFSLALLAILTAHESGHYVACRRYGVDATLPFFIPAPPLFLAGTFGAFIKIKSPIPSRRALFDIGVAGPLAGFIVAVPVAVIGVLLSEPAAAAPTGASIIFNDPLLFRLIAQVAGVHLDAASAGNPFYFAAWIGLLVTSLNLMPVGQLDGGHATFSLFGQRAHKWIGTVAFVTMATLAVLGWMWHRAPSGFLYAVLLAVMLRIRHPQAGDGRERLGRARIIVAVCTLLVFVLCFWPFPITITD
ncbi:MAG: site-2 protease family protein [Pyrinomonadaceae bacterium]|nr:site-2 protease family protein [Pyrinomonadaceae bacterium]